MALVTTHTVKAGETLWGIAVENFGDGTKYKQLAAINDIPNPDLIYIGQKIKLQDDGVSGKASSNSNIVTIKQFGLQSDIDNSLFVTWGWSKSGDTENYQVRWEFYSNDKFWSINESTTTYTYSTYSIPANATQVRVKIRPISKKDENDNPYWSASWSSYQTHKVTRAPTVPSVPTVTIDGLVLTAEVNNVNSDTSIIQFEVVKDNTTVVVSAKNSGKVDVKYATASMSCTITAGGTYKVRCRAISNGIESEWSNYSNNINTPPSTPSKLIKCEPKSDSSIYVEWSSIGNADSYDVEYTTKKSNFDGSDQTTTKTGITTTSYEISSGIETGKEYFFRVRAVNTQGTSAWSEISSTVLGKGPAAPTTWSSTTTVIVGEPLNLYWVHNSEDGSSQTFAHIKIYVNGVEVVDDNIENTASDDEKDKTSVYSVKMKDDEGNLLYPEGAQIQWQVRTAGISKQYGDWSILRTIEVYARPTLEFNITDVAGTAIGDIVDVYLQSFPIKVSAVAGPNTQRPIGYHLSVIANEFYETVDNMGNQKNVNEGEQIYSKYFDTSDQLSVEISAGDINLENNISYTINCVVSMNSGLSTEASIGFTVNWTETAYIPNAQINIDDDIFSAYIKPYCAIYTTVCYKVTRLSDSLYVVTTEVLGSVYGEEIDNTLTTTGEQVFNGMTADGEDVYFCKKEEITYNSNVILAVYRREFDGSFTEIASGLDAAKNIVVTDPHPALDYARYRIVATTKDTGAVGYYDMPGYPVGGQAVIIQWDEAWSNFDTFGSEDHSEEPTWSGSLLRLPYNIDVSNKHKSDVELVNYIGRKRPVSYYGTQLGETATWNVVIDKNDKETLYALRRLSVWMGNVYVREPSGSGYWASISVSFNQKHLDLTIPVTIEVTPVEGGM